MKNYKVSFSCSKPEPLGGNLGQNFSSLPHWLGLPSWTGLGQGVLHVVNSPEIDTEVQV